jgi:hypothetical protein
MKTRLESLVTMHLSSVISVNLPLLFLTSNTEKADSPSLSCVCLTNEKHVTKRKKYAIVNFGYFLKNRVEICVRLKLTKISQFV